jgi:hypothetical protein
VFQNKEKNTHAPPKRNTNGKYNGIPLIPISMATNKNKEKKLWKEYKEVGSYALLVKM